MDRSPADYLQERRNKYHLYSGDTWAWENPDLTGSWRESESTLWMLNIQRLMEVDNPNCANTGDVHPPSNPLTLPPRRV